MPLEGTPAAEAAAADVAAGETEPEEEEEAEEAGPRGERIAVGDDAWLRLNAEQKLLKHYGVRLES